MTEPTRIVRTMKPPSWVDEATPLQVASGRRADTGEPVVLLRLSHVIAELTPEGAADLGNALILEAAIARVGELPS